MLYRCVAAIPTNGGGCIEHFYEDNEEGHAAAEGFARLYDKRGFGVYDCVSALTARKRTKATVAQIRGLHADIDCYKSGIPKDDVISKLRNTIMQFNLVSVVNSSGRGVHVHLLFREPIEAAAPEAARAESVLRRLIEFLGADRQLSHFAALMRRPGTTNDKDGGGPCETLIDTGMRCDLHEVEEYLDLVQGEEAQFPYNGDSEGRAEKAAPVDLDERLATIEFGNTIGRGVNAVVPSVIATLIWRAEHPDNIYEKVMAALRELEQRQNLKWDWAGEEAQTRSRIASAYQMIQRGYSPAYGLPVWLPMEFHAAWADALARGKQPTLSRNGAGWHVRSYDLKEVHDAPPLAPDAPNGDAPKVDAPFILRPFKRVDPFKIPPREFLYGKHYQRRVVSCTAAPGGTGKSSLVLVESVAMAIGRDLLDEGSPLQERRRVWYHNGEDNMAELERRIVAICQHYNIPQEELEGQLFVTSGNEVPLRVAESWNQVKLSINHRLVKCITEQIGDNKIDVASLDPLVTLHNAREADPGQMDGVLRIFGGIADTQSCALDLSHHTRKLGPGAASEEITIDDVRGAKAISDAARMVRLLNYMSARDAEAAGLMEVERTGYFRIDRGKGNYSAPSKVAVWRQFQNVDLPNGDSVGVVVPWLFPGQDGRQSPEKAEADQRAKHVFLEALDRFTAQGRDAHERGPHNAPLVFAKEREAKVAKVSKAALANAMRQLFDEGKIRIEDHTGPSRHLTRRIVRA